MVTITTINIGAHYYNKHIDMTSIDNMGERNIYIYIYNLLCSLFFHILDDPIQAGKSIQFEDSIQFNLTIRFRLRITSSDPRC